MARGFAQRIAAIACAVLIGAYPIAGAWAVEPLSSGEDMAAFGFGGDGTFAGSQLSDVSVDPTHEGEGVEGTEGSKGIAADEGAERTPAVWSDDLAIEDVALPVEDESDADAAVEAGESEPEAEAADKAASEDEAEGSEFEEAAVGTRGVVSLAGETQYDTAAAEALYAFDSSDYAIVASGISAVDALSATSLAGGLDCPILLTAKSSLPDATANALSTLGVKHVIVVGGSAVISEDVARQIASITGEAPTRLWGEDLFDTQIAIYQYGAARNMWGSTVIAANGEVGTADALSISPVAVALRAPVFLTYRNGTFPDKTARVLGGANEFRTALAIGGPAVMSESTIGILDTVMARGGGPYPGTQRIWGQSLYDTSAEVAKWAVSNNVLKMNGAAFATGLVPFDSLAGSVVQGRERSVLMLIDTGQNATLTAAVSSRTSFTSVKFFGGNAVVTPSTRINVTKALNIPYLTVTTYATGITRERLAAIEYANLYQILGSEAPTEAQIMAAFDPNNYTMGTADYYQFVDLGQAYYGITAAQIDAFIAANCVYSEKAYGCTSMLRGTGAYFIEAGEKYNINSVYLLAHAIIESGWGCSNLAQGKISGFEGYYNFYGIGAYDSNPDPGGAKMAKYHGWTSSRLAIVGAAEWISDNYVHPTVGSATLSGEQRTLWQMRWDVRRAAADGTCWHQYASDRYWASSIARVMANCIDYCGVDPTQTGITYLIPEFS